MDEHLQTCQQVLEIEPLSGTVTRIAKERASVLKIYDINDISFLGTPDCHHCCSIA
jgi:hypothetical protein